MRIIYPIKFFSFMVMLFPVFILFGSDSAAISNRVISESDSCISRQSEKPAEGMEQRALNKSSGFILGVNYPWHNYGHDFGKTEWGHNGISSPENLSILHADFEFLKNHRVNVVRWFLFADCRAAPEFDEEGKVTGFDEYFFADMDMALSIAQQHHIHLILVLLDFKIADKAEWDSGVKLYGRASLITDNEVRQSFYDHALIPLLQTYGNHPNILAWEVMNEPELAIIQAENWVEEAVDLSAMQSFVNEIVDHIHHYTSQQVTLGSSRRRWLDLWTDSSLDYYQFHYYENMTEPADDFDFPYEDLELDKPCIIGEFPTKGADLSLTHYLNTILQNRYAGAFPWSYRAGDAHSDFIAVAEEFKSWADSNFRTVIEKNNWENYR